MNKILNRIIFCLISSYSFCSKITPIRIWLFIGRRIGDFFYFFSFKHRKIAHQNIVFALSIEDKKQISAIARQTFQNYGMFFQEIVMLSWLDYKDIEKRIKVEGYQNVIEAKRQSPSLIILGAHFGNWEYLNCYYAENFGNLNFIVKEIKNSIIEGFRKSWCDKFKVNVFYKKKNSLAIIRALKNKGDLVIFPDQNTGITKGKESLFFDRKTICTPSVPILAEKFKLLVLPSFIVREKNHINHKIVFLKAVDLGYKSNDELRLALDKQNKILEEMIRKYPTNWLWFHKRWKANFSDLYKNLIVF